MHVSTLSTLVKPYKIVILNSLLPIWYESMILLDN